MKTEKNVRIEGVGARIRELRDKNGMKQFTLAAEAGMSPAQLCHVERGIGKPTLRTLERIAKALGVETGELLRGKEEPCTMQDAQCKMQNAQCEMGNAEGGDELSSDALDRVRCGMHNAQCTMHNARCTMHNGKCTMQHAERTMGSGEWGRRDEACRPDNAETDPETGLWFVHDPRDAAVDRRVRARLKRETGEWKRIERAAGVSGRPGIPLRYPSAAEFGALLARSVRTAGGLGPAAVVDPVAFFAGKGVRILETKLPSGTDSWSLWDPEDGNAFVFLRKGTTEERKRFRVAYEMAHVARFVTGDCRTAIRDIRESRRISRAFAAAFLLPEEAVREAAGNLAVGPGDWTWELALVLKDGFGVSTDTFLYRIEELGMIPHARARALRSRLKEHYASCRAGGRTDFEPHAPRRAGGRLQALKTRAGGA